MKMVGRYGPINTTDEAYADGYKAGIGWTRHHTPGGPAVFTVRPTSDADWHTYCEQSRANHEAWMKGWGKGSGRQI